MAVGALFMSLRPGYTSGDLSAYLFGSIVTVTRGNVAALALLTGCLLVGALVWLRPVVYVLIAVTIVLSIRIMGIVLLISLVTMPVVIANTLSRDYRTITLAAPPVAVAGNVAGLAASYCFEVPPGAAIIFILTFTLVVVKLLPLRRQKKGSAA